MVSGELLEAPCWASEDCGCVVGDPAGVAFSKEGEGLGGRQTRRPQLAGVGKVGLRGAGEVLVGPRQRAAGQFIDDLLHPPQLGLGDG